MTSTCNTTCFMKVCLTQRTTYSVSLSVNSIGSDDLNSGPSTENSGTRDSCSERRVCHAWDIMLMASYSPEYISCREAAAFSFGFLADKAENINKVVATENI